MHRSRKTEIANQVTLILGYDVTKQCSSHMLRKGRLSKEIKNVVGHKEEGERRGPGSIPSLDDLEPGKICGAARSNAIARQHRGD
jgi:hypothetical protein